MHCLSSGYVQRLRALVTAWLKRLLLPGKWTPSTTGFGSCPVSGFHTAIRNADRRVRRSRFLRGGGDDRKIRIRCKWGKLVPLVALPNFLLCRCRENRISGTCIYFFKSASSPVSSHSIDLPNSRLILRRSPAPNPSAFSGIYHHVILPLHITDAILLPFPLCATRDAPSSPPEIILICRNHRQPRLKYC